MFSFAKANQWFLFKGRLVRPTYIEYDVICQKGANNYLISSEKVSYDWIDHVDLC